MFRVPVLSTSPFPPFPGGALGAALGAALGGDPAGLPDDAPPRLFLGQIAADFRPRFDRVAGPWCFVGCEGRYADWESLFDGAGALAVPELATAALRAKAVAKLDELIRYQVGLWRDRLNSRHQTDYGTGYWWTLTIRWLISLVSAAYRRRLVMDALIGAQGSDALSVIVSPLPATADWAFADTAAVVNHGLLNPAFDEWLWTRILMPVIPDAWQPIVCGHIPPTDPALAVPEPPVRTNAVKRLGRRLFPNLRFSDVSGFSVLETLGFSALLAVLPARTGGPVFRGLVPAQPPAGLPTGFLEMLDGLLACCLPASLGDSFESLRARVDPAWFKAGKLRITGQATTNDRGNHILARAVEAGERLVRVQHGGDYGAMTNLIAEKLPEYVNTAFFSWGWRSDECAGVQPLPVPGYSRMRAVNGPGGNGIILVGTKTWIRPCRLDQTPEPLQGVNYRREKVAFIKALSAENQSRLVYRPYERGPTDLEDRAYIRRHCPQIAFVEGDLADRMRSAALVVLDHPGTTLNANLALRIPTIGYWDPETWPITPAGREAFDRLRAAGVLFDSGAAAARFINDLDQPIGDWWQSAPVHSAVAAWAAEFALTHPAWRRRWLATVLRLSSKG